MLFTREQLVISVLGGGGLGCVSVCVVLFLFVDRGSALFIPLFRQDHNILQVFLQELKRNYLLGGHLKLLSPSWSLCFAESVLLSV